MAKGRPNKGLAHLDKHDVSELSRIRSRIVLQTVMGELSVHEACERLGIDRSRTMAIGDSMNDAAMLEWAGMGVLMGHAIPEMHVHADVLTGSEPGYGVAEALNALLP